MLSQSKPPLLSLKIHRTVDSIINTDQDDKLSKKTISTQQQIKLKTEQIIDHSEEIKTISNLLENQCFQFVAFKNQISDARKSQQSVMDFFHSRASELDLKLKTLQNNLMKKVIDLNKRVNIISKNISLQPIFRQISLQNEFGRITGISICENLLFCTTSNSYMYLCDRENLKILSFFHYNKSNSLFHPIIYKKGPLFYGFTLTSNQELLLGLPYSYKNPLSCFDLTVDCYAINFEFNSKDNFDLIIGRLSEIHFCSFQNDNPDLLLTKHISKNFRGQICNLLIDNLLESVFIVTTKRILYNISYTNYNELFHYQFDKPILQLFHSECFLILSIAPDDILILERSKDKINIYYHLIFNNGLRRFFTSKSELLIIMKNQKIQRRKFYDIEKIEIICEPYAADYNEDDYISNIISDDEEIFITHNNQISKWS